MGRVCVVPIAHAGVLVGHVEGHEVPHVGRGHHLMRGWRNMVGNLIEMFWLKKACHGHQFTGILYGLKPEAYGFIEFEISAVFRQPLTLGGALNARKFPCAQRDSLSERLLQERRLVTSARESLRETLRSSERFYFAFTRIEASIDASSNLTAALLIMCPPQSGNPYGGTSTRSPPESQPQHRCVPAGIVCLPLPVNLTQVFFKNDEKCST